MSLSICRTNIERLRAGSTDSSRWFARTSPDRCASPTPGVIQPLSCSLSCRSPRAGVITGPITVDAMSGTSGAGQDVDKAFLFSALHGSVAAYGTTEHRHVAEMERGLKRFGGLDAGLSFTPHLVPMARGLLATCRARLTGDMTDADATDILKSAYDAEPFVTVMDTWPATKAVAGTNRVLVSAKVDSRNDLLVCSAAIDNLGKGAAGQAIQNANVVLGLDESAGLEQVAAWP